MSPVPLFVKLDISNSCNRSSLASNHPLIILLSSAFFNLEAENFCFYCGDQNPPRCNGAETGGKGTRSATSHGSPCLPWVASASAGARFGKKRGGQPHTKKPFLPHLLCNRGGGAGGKARVTGGGTVGKRGLPVHGAPGRLGHRRFGPWGKRAAGRAEEAPPRRPGSTRGPPSVRSRPLPRPRGHQGPRALRRRKRRPDRPPGAAVRTRQAPPGERGAGGRQRRRGCRESAPALRQPMGARDVVRGRRAGPRLAAALSSCSPPSAEMVEAAARRLRLHLITWNVGTAQPPGEVAALLRLGAPEPPVDLYAVGLQEVNSRILSFLSDLAFEDPWTAALTAALAPLGYVRVSSIRMQGLLLLLFAKQAHLPFIRGVRSQFTRTGLHGYWGNKGGVSIRLSLYGHSVCFLNCHLPAHQENAKQRLDDFEHILEMQHFEEKKFPSALDHELLFWFGDLNFRINDYGLHFIRESISSSRFNLLWEKDQLNMARKEMFFLQEFSEGPLKFKPTYKFDLHSDEYDTSEKKRKPAWTDRILWRVKCLPCSKPKEAPREGGISLSLGSYTSLMDYNISDHKPVTGTFELKVQPLQMEPLVELCPMGTWSAEQEATVSYITAPEFASSAWDWIGLYRVSFRHANDYVTYVWVQDNEIFSEDGAKQVYLGAEGLPKAGGEFLLGYYSNALRSLVGLSQPVQVQPSPKSAEQQAGWAGASSAEHLPGERPPCDF